jgi:hypothetical protein
MKSFALICTLLLGLSHTPYAEPSAHITATYQATPEKAVNDLGNDAALLLRRAMEEPIDNKSIAILKSGTIPLQKRAQQLQPTYQAWMKTLTKVQREAYSLRMMKNNGLMTYLMVQEHNKKISSRLDLNPKLNQAATDLVNIAFLHD